MNRRRFLAAGAATGLFPASACATHASMPAGFRPDARVLRHGHGFTVDHIALGVPDMQAALGWLEEKTGVRPYATEPEPGQWYWSGALALGDDCFLELIGPNPSHDGFHTVKQVLLGYREPTLMFWYLATDDFAALKNDIERLGAPVEQIQEVRYERDGHEVHYQRGVVGPGFVTQRPCIIQWHKKMPRPELDRSCRLRSLTLRHPNAAAMRAVLEPLGVSPLVEAGEPWIGVELETPRGLVTFGARGEDFTGAGAMWRMVGLYLQHLTG